MATISCTPADLAAAAKCFQCLPSEQKQWIDTYLLAVIAKGSTDPNTLALAAKCFQCIPSGMLRRIQAYLLCQIASGGGGPCPQDMQVAWTPTSAKLGQELGFFTFGDIPSITSITFNQATSIAGFDIEFTTALTSVSWPNLVSVDPLNTQSGYIDLTHNSVLTSFSLPLLQSLGGQLTINNNASLAAAAFPSLVSVGGQINLSGNTPLTSISIPNLISIGDTLTLINLPNLTSASFPALTTIGAINGTSLNSTGCPNLSTFSAPLWVPTDGIIAITGAALNAASVNAILHQCVLNAGFVSGPIDLSGGTSAAPSGQGVADKATLIGRGVAVNTN